MSLSVSKPLSHPPLQPPHGPCQDINLSPSTLAVTVREDTTASGCLPLNNAEELYTLSHMELVCHFEHSFIPAVSLGSSFGVTFLKIALSQAFKAPYLMDQIVSLSAAHRSTTTKTEAYRAEAVRLQTRALARYRDVQSRIVPENCLPAFLFSSMLGQQLLFEALSYRGEFATGLDLLVQCFSLHRGTRAIAEHSWPSIQAQFEAISGEPYPLADSMRLSTASESSGPFSDVQALIRDASFNEDSKTACLDATEFLRENYLDQLNHQCDLFRRAESVHTWAINVPLEYIEVLRQRRPEALIILAMYGVLLHDAREYWSFGDAGRNLIQSISSYLGSYWSQWLVWPNKEIE